MNTAQYVRQTIGSIFMAVEHDDAVSVTTSCLYPSNSLVTVFIRGGPNGAVVSDDGRAIDELTALNRDIPNADKFLRKFCVKTGLEAKNGKIFSPMIFGGQLPAAVVFVANASAAAVSWGVNKLKVSRARDLRKELEDVLAQSLPASRIERNYRVEGQSTRNYRFDHVVHLGSQVLIFDPVNPDANSINARAIAHFDVGNRKDDQILQHLVYDEDENWKTSDLGLLQMAATIVPLSRADGVVRDYAAML